MLYVILLRINAIDGTWNQGIDFVISPSFQPCVLNGGPSIEVTTPLHMMLEWLNLACVVTSGHGENNDMAFVEISIRFTTQKNVFLTSTFDSVYISESYILTFSYISQVACTCHRYYFDEVTWGHGTVYSLLTLRKPCSMESEVFSTDYRTWQSTLHLPSNWQPYSISL